jgi:hypothetical protein
MSDIQNKNYIKSFMQENINEKQFNSNKVCDGTKYNKVIKNSINVINNLDETETEFHMTLCKFIKNKKISLVDEEYFNEKNVESFVYAKMLLSIISIT